MNGPIKVPMPNRDAFIADGHDIAAGVSSLRTGTRVHVDISDEAIARIGKHAIAGAVEALGEAVAYRHQADIQAAVHSYIFNREWAEPLIRAEIEKNVARILDDMFQNTALADFIKGRREV